MSTPYIGFGNDTLKKLPRAKKGQLIDCQHCGKNHAIECATSDGEESDLLMFFACGEATYLAAIDGRLVNGIKPSVSGSVDL